MAILEYIEVHQSEYVGKGVPERILRQEFGNNPDTSKALRFLVSEKKIIRAGLGGRRDPFSYTMADPVAEEDGKTEAKKENKQQERVTVGEEREEKDENYEVLHPCSGTPANGTFAVEACAAAAALAAPSTGKWLSPDPILRRETARHRVQHPRLSLSMGDGKLAGKETDITMADVSLQARKRSAPLQTPPPSHLKDLASKKPALEICSASAVNVNNASTPSRIAHNSESQDQQQMLPTSTGPWGSWPTQLPISQRLSASTKPPSASLEPSTATKTGTLFLTERAGATEAVAQQASQQATQAFFLQLRAAQLFWQHRQLTAGGEISVTQEGSLQQPNTENAYSYPH